MKTSLIINKLRPGFCCWSDGFVDDDGSWVIANDRGMIARVSPKFDQNNAIERLDLQKLERMKKVDGTDFMWPSDDPDIEAMVKLKNGDILVCYERKARWFIYKDVFEKAFAEVNCPSTLLQIAKKSNFTNNGLQESLGVFPDGKIVLLTEGKAQITTRDGRAVDTIVGWIGTDKGAGTEPDRFSFSEFYYDNSESNLMVSGLVCSQSNSDYCFCIERRFDAQTGIVTGRIVYLCVSCLTEGQTIKPKLLFPLCPQPFPSENYELIIIQNVGDERYFFIMVDDNDNPKQKTIIAQAKIDRSMYSFI